MKALDRHGEEGLLPWHVGLWPRLFAYVQSGRVPHGLLLSGQVGVGKYRLAKQLANTLLCSGGRTPEGLACGRCSDCRLFKGSTHPDFIMVGPKEEGKDIPIAVIRDLSAALALRPHHGGYRIVLISPAHHMNRHASNSLLKTLEEPVENTVIILISHLPYAIPATLRSRCQRVHVDTPDREIAAGWLHAANIGMPDASLSAALGAPLLAADIAATGALEAREALFQALFVAWPARSGKGEDPSAAAAKWAELPMEQVLSWLITWVIDTIRLGCAPGVKRLFDLEHREGLKRASQRLNLQRLYGYLDALLAAQSLAKSTVNKQMMLEDLFIRWFNLHEWGK